MFSMIVSPSVTSNPANTADTEAEATKAQFTRGKPIGGKAKNTIGHTIAIVITMNTTLRISLSSKHALSRGFKFHRRPSYHSTGRFRP
jgi:hypothetical protein